MKALLLTLLLYAATPDSLPVLPDTLSVEISVANLGDSLYVYRRWYEAEQEKRERLVYFVDRKKQITFLRRDPGRKEKDNWIY